MDELIGVLEIGPLTEGDIVSVETQVRLRDLINYSTDMMVMTGAFVTTDQFSLPNEENVVSVTNTGLSTSERWLSDDSYTFFHRSGAALIEADSK